MTKAPLLPTIVLGDDLLSVGGQVRAMTWSPGSEVIAVLGNHQHVCLFNAVTGASVADHGMDGLCHLVASPTTDTVIVGNHLGLWRINRDGSQERIFAFEPYQGPEGWSVARVLGSRDARTAVLYEEAGFPVRHHRIRIVDMETGRLRANITIGAELALPKRSFLDRFRRAPHLVFNGLALTPDGQTLGGVATISRGSHRDIPHGVILTWACDTGRLTCVAEVPEEVVFLGNSGCFSDHLAISPNGRYMATQSHIIEVSTSPSWHQLASTAVQAGRTGLGCFVNDSSLATAGSGGLMVMPSMTSTSFKEYPASSNWFALGMSASPDGKILAVADETRLRLFALPDLTPLLEPLGHSRPVEHLVANDTGDHLVSAEAGRTITWDIPNRTILATRASGVGWGMAMSPDGQQLLVAASSMAFLSVADLAVQQPIAGWASAVAWPESERPVAVGDSGDDEEPSELQVRQGAPLTAAGSMTIPKPRCVPALSADGRIIVLSNDDITFCCDLTHRKILWKKAFSTTRVAVSADGGLVVMDAGDPRGLVLCDGDVGVELGVIGVKREKHLSYRGFHLTFARHRLRLAIALGDHRATVVDLTRVGKNITMTQRDLHSEHRPHITAIAFSGDGHWLFTGGAEGRISAFDLR